PDRAIGPTDDQLYRVEEEFNDSDLAARLDKNPEELAAMPIHEKRDLLMTHRKEQLRMLIDIYYQERGWNSLGIPMPETLKQLGLWEFLDEKSRSTIIELTSEEKKNTAETQRFAETMNEA
ncbi:MAG: aldehyde ferredoxin oxidoreductase C-terminal domain-containing protein, partial [Acidobacteriota bacterium]